MALFRKKTDVNMTEGNIAGHLLRFAFPLLLGNLFQQLYNTVDSWVVGNYVSNAAFSAVGTISPIVNFFVSFFTGLSMGAGVLVSQFYGAGQKEKVSRTVHDAFFLVVVFGIIMSAVSVALSPALLRLMNTPEDVFDEANIYMRVYCSGLLFLVVYNLGAALLRAVGDTTRPFYFLVVTTVVNTCLDLLFVLVFRMGVKGVALATVIAEAVSMVFIMVSLVREKSAIRFQPEKLLTPDAGIMRQIVKIGMPSGTQMAVTSFSNIFVQSYINYFGTDVMGGWTCFSKVERLALLPIQSLSAATMTFVGQNLGADNVKRAKKGVNVSVGLGFGILVLVIPVTWIFAPELTAFFNSKAEVVSSGTQIIRLLMPFMVIALNNNIHTSALRGAGDSRSTMLIILFCYVVLRQIYLFVMANFISNTIVPIALSYPFGWIMATVIVGIYYHKNADRVYEEAAARHRKKKAALKSSPEAEKDAP